LASSPVVVDCDVDAADLHLVLSPTIEERHEFRSGKEATIRQSDCAGCGSCYDVCRFSAVEPISNPDGSETYSIDPLACEGCGVCVHFCPERAIDFEETVCGEWYVSQTRHGPFVHARLGIAAENSGKLVTLVRKRAKQIAEQGNHDLVLVDGPPGIGCPVIAALSGASALLVVTEPTVSGLHDLRRIVDLAWHFHLPVSVCINKYDINETVGEEIIGYCQGHGLSVVGKIPYDSSVTAAQVAGRSVVQHNSSPAARAIGDMWNKVQHMLK
jgi:MinD superfamily P-loop ATPase